MEEKELYIEKMKNEMNRMFDQRKMKRNQDREIKLQQYREKEKEVKIFFRSVIRCSSKQARLYSEILKQLTCIVIQLNVYFYK